jgi:hypothetical protein
MQGRESQSEWMDDKRIALIIFSRSISEIGNNALSLFIPAPSFHPPFFHFDNPLPTLLFPCPSHSLYFITPSPKLSLARPGHQFTKIYQKLRSRRRLSSFTDPRLCGPDRTWRILLLRSTSKSLFTKTPASSFLPTLHPDFPPSSDSESSAQWPISLKCRSNSFDPLWSPSPSHPGHVSRPFPTGPKLSTVALNASSSRLPCCNVDRSWSWHGGKAQGSTRSVSVTRHPIWPVPKAG